MALILDTYNVIHAGAAMGGAMSDLTVRKLCQWLRMLPGRQKVSLVLDGRAKPDEPSANEFPEIHLIYSGAGVSADDVIARMAEQAANRKKLIVVTNDRAVQAAARRVGARPQACEVFLGSLVAARTGLRSAASRALPSGKMEGVSSKGETDQWLKEFGITAEPVKKEKPKRDGGADELDIGKLMGF